MPTVAVTGGSGHIGRAIVAELKEHGYTVWNLDQVRTATGADRFVRVDITDQGQVFNALAGAEFVVHMAAIPSPGGVSDDYLMRVNVLGTFHVLQAAALFGVRRMALASSISAFGLAWGRRFSPSYLPIDEAHPLLPEDVYGLSKQLDEVCAAAFARRYGMAIGLLRFPTVLAPEQVPRFKQQLQDDPELAARLLWAYVDVRDAATACRLVLEADFTGAEPFYVTAQDHMGGDRVEALLDTYYPGVPRRAEFDPQATFWNNRKAATMLGYRPRFSWV